MPNELQEYKVVYIKYKTVYMKCLIAYTIKSQNDKMVNMRCSWFHQLVNAYFTWSAFT